MLAIIPARGGSKGVPRKNIRELNGCPLIHYAIDAAKNCDFIDRIIVSTEDKEIADVASKYGAEVPFIRPIELAADNVGNTLACLDVIKKLETMGERYSEFCLIQPTCPLFSSVDLDLVIRAFNSSKADAAVTMTPFEYPIESVFEINETGYIRNVVTHLYGGVFKAGTRQSFGSRYSICGAAAVLKVDKLESDSEYLHKSPSVIGVVIDEIAGWDIDTELDLKIAEFLISQSGIRNLL